jgi:ammonia channel protein AmtB
MLDDVLDVTSLQGTPGIVGSILAGFFATTESGNSYENIYLSI